jgi:branched-chain amino acid transport system permease protein
MPSRRTILFLVLLALAAAVPLMQDRYYINFASQIAIFGMAALSVDLMLGYGGLVTFGQAAFLGVGAYAAGMISLAGFHEALIVWPLAMLAAMGFALVIGAFALRTEGFQFIMVTLAFAQMVYYIGESLRAYGGDNGFTFSRRNTLAGINLTNPTVFYYVVLGMLVLVVYLASRLVKSQFGMVVRGRRDNERRLAALGFPPFWYKYTAFIIAAAIAGLAGALMANYARFVSPALLSWQVSGQLLSMVILGSAGTLIGPIFGAAIYLVFQQILSDPQALTAMHLPPEFADHWMIFFGPLLIARVLFVKEGVWGILVRTLRAQERPISLPAPAPEEGAAE